MAKITVIIIESEGAAQRKRLKETMPTQVREALNSAGLDVEMESGEELRKKLPRGFPDKFVVPEEVLVFPAEEEDKVNAKRRRRMRDMNNSTRRKKLPGNAEA